MKKIFRTLCAALALTVCLCLPAFAQEAIPAQPAAKEDKVVTDLTGRDAFLRDVKGFTTNFGGPYVFAQADHKSPAEPYGAAPAEGSVATLRIYTMSDDKGDASINASGHAFVSVTNVSDRDINVGGLLIAPGKAVTIGTRGNRSEHSGIWYDLESYYMYYIPDYYYHLYAMQTSLDAGQLEVLNRGLRRADHWSACYNCSAFSEAFCAFSTLRSSLICAASSSFATNSCVCSSVCFASVLASALTLPVPSENADAPSSNCAALTHTPCVRTTELTTAAIKIVFILLFILLINSCYTLL